MVTADIFDQETYNNVVLLIDAFETAALESETREGIIMSMQGPIAGFKQILEGADGSLRKMKETGAPPGHKSKSTSNSTGDMSNENDESEVVEYNTADSVEAYYSPGNASGFSLNTTNGIPEPSLQIGGGSFNGSTDYASLLNMSEENAAKFQSYMWECWNCNTRITFNWQIPLVDLLAPIMGLLNDINKILEEIEELTNPTNFLKNFCKWMNWFTLICPADWIALLMALKMLFTRYLTFALSVKLDWTVLLGPIVNFIVDALSNLIKQIAGIILNPLDCLEGIFETLLNVEYQAKDTYATMKSAKQEFVDRLKDLKAGEILPGQKIEFVATGLYWDPVKKKFIRANESITGDQIADWKSANKAINPWQYFVSGVEVESVRTMKEAIQHPKTEDLFFNKFVAAIKEAKDGVQSLFMEILMSLNSIKGLVAGGLSAQMEAYGFMLLLISIIRMVIMIIALIKENDGISDWCEYIEEHPDKLEDALKRFVDPNASVKQGKVSVAGQTIQLSQCISSRDPKESVMIQKWINDLSEKKNEP